MKKGRASGAAIVAAACLACGCEGPMFNGTIFEQQRRADPQVAHVATESQQNGIALRQLSEQIDALNRSQALLEQRIARMEAAQARPGQDGAADIAALRRDVEALRVQQENARRDIAADLAARIEKVAARQGGGQAPAPGPRPGNMTAGGAAPAARSGYEHKVERGQTLTEIARGYGVSVQSIMKANRISNPSAIRVGQKLFIPDK